MLIPLDVAVYLSVLALVAGFAMGAIVFWRQPRHTVRYTFLAGEKRLPDSAQLYRDFRNYRPKVLGQ